jgi:hypothetical protein
VERLDLGVTPEGLLRTRVDPLAAGLSPAEAAAFHRAAAERLRALPGVVHAGVAIGAPFSTNYAVGIRVAGLDSLPRLAGGGPYIFRMDAGAINALDLRIIRGRTFTEADDRAGAPPVVVITDRMARTLWPEADPIGHCVMTSALDYACAAVVGVVADLNRQGLREPPFMALFMPLATAGPDDAPEMMLVRTAGPPERMVETIRRALLEIRSDLPYVSITPFESLVAPHARSWRLGATVFTAFGLLSLVVAGIGVYGVLSFSVARRLPELGIRTALGATSRHVLRLVVGGGVATAATGVVLGAGVAFAFAGRVQELLFDTRARDPVIYLMAGATLLGLALLASLVPALRAARADPLTVLRSE